ncbi:ABC transporter permease [Mesoplasma lactucae]|uniref:Uncharacterized protein n=1 Tax=Mesoplasma lactucae ATCC 49193 TaxID=81460 RepID=A0A291IS69_9MOLU|nr:ABC transporter permease [Mesoplasma lactucae]ATG97594.1 hypothetical protein CP520_02410 [Mesoplasma lactucae ATCC 49193]
MNKVNKNQTLELTKTRFEELRFKKKYFILYGIIGGLILLFSVGIGVISLVNDFMAQLQMYDQILMIASALSIGIYTVVISVWLFRGEKDNNIIKNEQHYGYKSRAIFLSRLIELITWIALILLTVIIFNLIITASFNGFNGVMLYQYLISALGWYAITAVMGAGLTVLFATFANVLWTSLVGTLLIVLTLILPMAGGFGSFDAGKNAYDKKSNLPDSYNSILLVNRISNIATADKETKILEQWEDFAGKTNQGWGPDNGNWTNYTFGWNEKDWDQTKFEKEYKLYSEFDNLFKNNKNDFADIHYSDISGFAGYKSYANEPLNKLLTKLLKYDLKDYKPLVQALKDNYTPDDYSGIELLIPSYKSGYGDDDTNWEQKAEDSGANSAAQVMFYQFLVTGLNESASYINRWNYEIKDPFDFQNIAKKIAKKAIYNPLTQFNLMFFGVDCKHGIKTNYANQNSYIYMSLAMYKLDKTPNPTDKDHYTGWYDIQPKRVVKVEGLYVGYFVLNALLIFASYWIFRKQIKK